MGDRFGHPGCIVLDRDDCMKFFACLRLKRKLIT
jgi:hypothetical protein